MKKKLIALALALMMLLSLAGCGKKTTLHMTVDGIGNYEVTQIPAGFDSYNVVDNTIDVTVKKDGVYTFVVTAEDGQEYSFTLNYSNGTAAVEADDGLSVVVGAK